MRHNARDMSKSEIEGVTLDVAAGDTMRAPPISVGTLQFIGVNITYGDMFIFDRWRLNHEPTLVLGMDVLGTVDILVIDHAEMPSDTISTSKIRRAVVMPKLVSKGCSSGMFTSRRWIASIFIEPPFVI